MGERSEGAAWHRGTFGHMGVTLAIRSISSVASTPPRQTDPEYIDHPGRAARPIEPDQLDHVVEHCARRYDPAREPIEGLSGQLAGLRAGTDR